MLSLIKFLKNQRDSNWKIVKVDHDICMAPRNHNKIKYRLDKSKNTSIHQVIND